MDPDNPVVKLCVAGMRAEGEGRLAEARDLFRQAWATSRDDFEACVAAHYVARHQDSPEETLRWNEEALKRADALGNPRVLGFYSSLYLNLGHSHEVLGHLVEARRWYDLAAEGLVEAPTGRYGDVMRGAIENARLRTKSGQDASRDSSCNDMMRLTKRAQILVAGKASLKPGSGARKLIAGSFKTVDYPLCYAFDLPIDGFNDTVPKPATNPAITISIVLLALTTLLSASPASAQPAGGHFLYLPLVARANTNPVHRGLATYYNATGAGACSFDASPGDLLVAAMNAPDYQNAAVCGEYVSVKGPLSTVTVRIVDLCPDLGCQTGHLDLSQQAFAQIAELRLGVVPITWQVISPPLAGPIAYHFKDGSNQWWTAVQIRNHRNPIAKLEYLQAPNRWVSVPRTSYNYFVQTTPGMGLGPYTFRVTDSYGNVLTDSGIPLMVNGTVNGSGQFPPGP